ncbi:MAG: hypothetical protein KAR06_10490, partial [Deltaproteobacteria bacterium]|nr:hypothetical protein [Deltaproteobacteria bacterium]
RRNFVARHLKKQGLDKDFKKEKGLLDSDTKTGKKPETFTERMVAAMKAMKKEAAAIGEIAKARRETRINNLNLNVEQNVQIDAPAAKTGETGLSGQGLDAAMRKAQTALWTAQLNKLTTASIGS